MKYERIGSLLILLLISGWVHAQTVSPAVVAHFDAAVVEKVYEVNGYANLNDRQQWVLATMLNKRDSILEKLIVGGKSSSEVDRQRAAMDKEIGSLEGVGKYYDSLAVLQGKVAAKRELRLYGQYHMTRECQEKIVQLMSDKYYRLAKIDQQDPGSSRIKDSLENAVCHVQDSLVQSEMTLDGVFVSSSQIAAALHMRKPLHLSDGQTDSLVQVGMHLTYMKDSAYRKDPMAPLDTKEYENYSMSVILTEVQYANVLALQYRHSASINAEHDWNDLVKRGLVDAGKDKERVMRAITDYYIRVKSSSCMYAYDLNKQAAHMRSVRDDMPKELKQLQYARRANITSANMQSITNQ